MGKILFRKDNNYFIDLFTIIQGFTSRYYKTFDSYNSCMKWIKIAFIVLVMILACGIIYVYNWYLNFPFEIGKAMITDII